MRNERSPGALLISGAVLAVVLAALPAAAGEQFTARGAVASSGGGSVPLNVAIGVDGYVTEEQRDAVVAAVKENGNQAAVAMLHDMPGLGYLEVSGNRTPIQYAFSTTTATGRRLVVAAREPILNLGGGLPPTRSSIAYPVAVAIVSFDAEGVGTGELAPVARIDYDETDGLAIADRGAGAVALSEVKLEAPEE